MARRSRELEIKTPRVFVPLLSPARYKGIWGGRGSGKSHFFAEMGVERALSFPGEYGEGFRLLCYREVQKSLKESAKHLIESKLEAFGLGQSDGFRVFVDRIETPRDGVIIFAGLQDHTAESIKSYEGFHAAWGEEAQTISRHSLTLLRPTIREAGSELWFSWNPRRPTDAVDELLRGASIPTNAKVVRANWKDNPFFPEVLEQERLDCLRMRPEEYDHIWEGGYSTVTEGAYYARQIAEGKTAGRIGGHVSPDPLLTIRLFADIGGTGAKADAFCLWAAQFVGREIRVIDYYEAVGQPLGAHLEWMRSKGYTPYRAQIWLPHDGAAQDKVYDVSYESSLSAAGYHVEVIPNQGRGAATARIEVGRRMFGACWFDEKCKAGLDALGWYHEKKDEARGIGLGPEHDWASHGSDAFGLMCIVAENHFSTESSGWGGKLNYPSLGKK